MNHMQNIHFDILYEIAQGREALLDDPPTAAFQIEEGLHFIKKNINLIPSLKKDFNFERFIDFYEDIAQKIYQKFKS